MMKKVLFIEDNEDVRELTAEILELASYKVLTANNGIEGVKKAQQFAPDIILCDIMMPELDGYGVLQILSKNPKTASIPFIFVTAKSEKADMRKGMNLGADDYLVKPFEENELLDAIESRLKKNIFLKKEFSRNIEGINEFFEEAAEYFDMEDLAKNNTIQEFKAKENIFVESRNAHSLYFIKSGTVKTHKNTEKGKELVTGIHNAGDFIGQLSLLCNSKTYIETATAMNDSSIYVISKEDFIKLLYGNKLVAQKFISLISNNLVDLQEQMIYMAFAPVRQKVAKALLELYDKGVIKNNAHFGVGIPRDDFAGMIGTATETAIRTLSEFKDEGLIDLKSGRRIALLNKEKLRHIADSF